MPLIRRESCPDSDHRT